MYQILNSFVPAIPVSSVKFEELIAQPNPTKHVTCLGLQEGNFALSVFTNSFVTEIHD